MYRVRPLFVGGLATLCLPAFAADELASFQSFNGYTGLINTPTAEVLDTGIIDIGYNNQLDLRGSKYEDGHNYIFSAGLFDGLEVSGQIAANSMNDNLFYTEGRGQTRDLSFNAKYQIPYIPKNWFSLAFGAKDVGGAANNYETYYAVASKELGDFRFSAGISKSERLTGQMDGAFAGIEWQPFDWFTLQAEHDGEAENAAARITIPKKWLYDVGTLTLTSRFYSSSDFDEESTYWGVNFSTPLTSSVKHASAEPAPQPVKKQSIGGNSPDPQYLIAKKSAVKNNALEVQSTHDIPRHVAQHHTEKNSASKNVNRQVSSLKAKLAQDGFENLLVGFNSQNQIIVQFENSIFNRNDIDAFGLVLGRIAEYITPANAQFNVVLAKYDIPLMSITGQVDNYREFIEGNLTPDLNVTKGALVMPKGVTWVGLTRTNSPYFKPRVTFGPALTNSYATELGVYDFSLALRADIDIPLWYGAGVTAGGQVHVANSDDFDKDAPFRRLREKTGIDRAVFYQTLELPFGLYNQTQVGFFKETYDYTGITNETTWLSDAGRHKVTANVGYFEYEDYQGNRDYKTLSYQYNWVEKNITLHATAGEFWSEDTGAKVESRFWFGDSYLSLFLEDTAVRKVGIAFSIPLTPRKDMNVTRFGQVKGAEAWRHTASTQIGESHNQLVFNQGYTPSTAISLDKTFLNQGRMSSDYIYGNLSRLKDVYIKYK
ncbi:YjbH domain-containing protein [Pseudoalteromonas sp. SWN29]|uniref:YjbH domain-containing protein n=1 Tax=Pseudoalteromonas sp. SWN29 TaxID=2792064 RepID=UPI0018CE21F8|nr:YjbH domain-containing protein [Pseudoalteromonas sp. SWN29]MBH0029179.1 YjbH domain-containing protein [Pseudoalteromonas sp. SWN29]